MATTRNNFRHGQSSSSSSSAVDDDILEITQVQPANKQEEERRFARQREAILNNDEMKFMADFDPDNSMRKLKKRRRYYQDGRPVITADEFDICDCLEPKCPGCHFECPSCGGTKCGQACREGRRWIYESVEVEGRNKTLRHPHQEKVYAYASYDA
jgi:hypothetical protein